MRDADLCGDFDSALSRIIDLARRVPPIRLRARMARRCLRKLRRQTDDALFLHELVPEDRPTIGAEELDRINAFLELLSEAAEKSDEPPEQILNRVVYLSIIRGASFLRKGGADTPRWWC